MKRLPFCLSVLAIAITLLSGSRASAQTAPELIEKGDVHDNRFEANAALNYYLPAEKLEPKNVELLLRIARQYRHLMSDVPSNAEKIRLGTISLGYAQRAAALGPASSDAQLSPAITYGKMLSIQGKKEQVEASSRIKVSAEKSIRLNPQNDLAWHILGRWHQVLANIGAVKRTLGSLIYGQLPTTTNEEAIKCFEKAISLNPGRLRHYIELGRTYAQMGRTADAQRYIKKGLAMPNQEHDDPELKERGRDTLKTLK